MTKFSKKASIRSVVCAECKIIAWSFLAASGLTLAQLFDFGGLFVLPFLAGNYLLALYFFVRTFSKLFQKKITTAFVYASSCTLLAFFSGIPFVQAGKYEVTSAFLYLVKNRDAVVNTIANKRRLSSGTTFTAEFLLGGGYATPSILVYDESRELLLPYENRSQTWHELHANSEYKCAHTVQPVKTNFFLVNFAC